jgi:bis(5'-nucleosyl)-tetraphosphatase (symmetrical)
MPLYAIGDVQGCHDSLLRLLEKIRFDPSTDRLWFTGDLVNRGPRSAEVVRFVASLGDRAVTVLGNHDLHLLAVAAGVERLSVEDALDDILSADDSERLLSWIARRPLFHRDVETGYSLVHAGLLPQWSVDDAVALAHEVETIIGGSGSTEFFAHMYGNAPDCWTDTLSGWERWRLIVNGFTRVRFCYADGRMDFAFKGPPGSQANALLPWFQIQCRRSRGQRIVFGHWSALGRWQSDGVIGVDTGCLWGRQLTAVRLDLHVPQFVSIRCPAYKT